MYMLNRVGASTLPWGSPFRCLHFLLPFLSRWTKKRLAPRSVLTKDVNRLSSIILLNLLSRRLWFTVSYAAERSTKTAPVTNPCSYPSSMSSVNDRSWPVHDLPGRIPACCGMRCLSTYAEIACFWIACQLRCRLPPSSVPHNDVVIDRWREVCSSISRALIWNCLLPLGRSLSHQVPLAQIKVMVEIQIDSMVVWYCFL